ncbi:MAG: single-stranded-DNA-specific exonuclease RecJ [Prochlorotrichaceae cyanobacterium]
MEWQLLPTTPLPPWLITLVKPYIQDSYASGEFAAQLLWQRDLRERQQVLQFLDPNHYTPCSPWDFGEEMVWAIDRLEQAWLHQEKVAIWGDFDADGVTATAVLWEGLGQWFKPTEQLSFFIPDRLRESHGLSFDGLDQLAQEGVNLIVTCDTGCTNDRELAYAQSLGLEVIVTDHHTLPVQRPPAVALINPRSFPRDHPLATLSGVAVAYKLLEALYDRLPAVEMPLENLLDLVVIGLIADLVELKGDCRYLAQKGLKRLQSLPQESQRRPGVASLLKLCKRSGDRPSDISFGIGPRINAVSRVIGDTRIAVELLTSRDADRCQTLAEEVELLNTRRKGLQQTVLQEVKQKLALLDWSTSPAIILAEVGWPPGLLGLVAGQLMQEYQRPVILLSLDESLERNPNAQARGSGRSLAPIDLYDLLESQRSLLNGFGGHPLAAGLSLPGRNIPLFQEGIHQVLRNRGLSPQKILRADLQVTVADLNLQLFRELKALDPYGMGHPEPLLLLRKVRFTDTFTRKLKDAKGNKVAYRLAHFKLQDDTSKVAVPGVWWGHTQDELPPGDCDVLVQFIYNVYDKRCEVCLEALRPTAIVKTTSLSSSPRLLDFRDHPSEDIPASALPLTTCPPHWTALSQAFQTAQRQNCSLALGYGVPEHRSPSDIVQQWFALAQTLLQTAQSRAQIQAQLGISDRVLEIALWSLAPFGIEVMFSPPDQVQLRRTPPDPAYPQAPHDRLQILRDAIAEEQFRQRYFATASCEMLEQLLSVRG